MTYFEGIKVDWTFNQIPVPNLVVGEVIPTKSWCLGSQEKQLSNMLHMLPLKLLLQQKFKKIILILWNGKSNSANVLRKWWSSEQQEVILWWTQPGRLSAEKETLAVHIHYFQTVSSPLADPTLCSWKTVKKSALMQLANFQGSAAVDIWLLASQPA